MEINFNDKEIFNSLTSASLLKIEIGSLFYGTNIDKSDENYLIIYAEGKLNSLTTNFPFILKYKNFYDNYLFISLQNFIYYLLNQDKLIIFETLNSAELKYNINGLNWFHKNKKMFYTSKILKYYLNISKIDLKKIKIFKNFEDYECRRLISHLHRNMIYIAMILQGKNDINSNKKVIIENKKIKLEYSHQILKELVEFYEFSIKDFNKKINKSVKNGNIKKHLTIADYELLTTFREEFFESSFYKLKVNRKINYNNILMDKFLKL